jgi:hypothetical protein
VQTDCVDKGVSVAGGLEVDQTGIGGAVLMDHDVVGFRVPMAQSQERAWRVQLLEHCDQFGCCQSGDGYPERCGAPSV